MHQFFPASVQSILLTCNSLPDKELALFREFPGREKMNELFIRAEGFNTQEPAFAGELQGG
jgi:hypothetical protein